MAETIFDAVAGSVNGEIGNNTFIQPTTHANITIVSGGYVKIGSLVVVNIVFTASSEIPNWTGIFSNLPTTDNTVPCKCVNFTNTDLGISLYEIVMNTGGSIGTTSNGSRKISSSGRWALSCVYISNQ